MTSPVQWETTIKNLLTKGLKKGYELGPGKVVFDLGVETEFCVPMLNFVLFMSVTHVAIECMSGYSWHRQENGQGCGH